MAGEQNRAEWMTYRIDWEANKMEVIDTSSLFSGISYEPVPISPSTYAMKTMMESAGSNEAGHTFLLDCHYKGDIMTIKLHHSVGNTVLLAAPELLERMLRRKLTPRETQVAIMLFGGSTIRSIASQLHIAEGTVKRINYNIYQKCNVGSQVELIREIYRQLAEAQSLLCPVCLPDAGN